MGYDLKSHCYIKPSIFKKGSENKCRTHDEYWPCKYLDVEDKRTIILAEKDLLCTNCLGEGGRVGPAMPDVGWNACSSCEGTGIKLTIVERLFLKSRFKQLFREKKSPYTYQVRP